MQKTILLHRQIMEVDNGIIIDHINNNGLDNRRCNIRASNNTSNQMNRRKQIPKSSSVYKGVNINHTKRKRKDGSIDSYIRFISTIRVNKKLIYLGRYTDQRIAALAYDRAAKKYFGEFANLNFKCLLPAILTNHDAFSNAIPCD